MFYNRKLCLYSIFVSRILVFSTELFLKIQVFQLSNCFVLQRTHAIDIQSILYFLNSSFMIFWQMVTPLDCLSIYFLLFQLKKCIRGRVVSTICFRSFAEDRKAVSISVQFCSLWPFMSSTQIRLFIKLKLKLLLAHA